MKKAVSLFAFIVMLAGMLVPTNTFAQEEESAFSFSADVVNRYIWRGINLGSGGAAIQPGIEVALGSTGLAVGAWGSYTLSTTGASQEADLYLSYSPIDAISIGVTDYFFPADDGGNDYFNYKGDETAHTVEAMISFNGTETIPVTATFAMNVFGADKDYKGDDRFSTYLELGYATEIKGAELSLFAGATLTGVDQPKEGTLDAEGELIGEQTGFYNQTGAALINLGMGLSKEIKITDSFSLPVNTSLIFNPDAGNIFIVFGFSL